MRATAVFAIAAVAGLSAASLPGAASAATIHVASTQDAQNGSLDDPGCTLRDAIQAANDNASAANGCNGDNGGGTGVDTILLQGGQTYKLTLHAAPENANASGDLDITGGGGTIIRSSGPGLATIDADSTTFPGPADDQRGRAIDIIAGAGAVTLDGIRVQGGAVTDSTGGGGIKTRAPLKLVDSEVTGNNVAVFGGQTNFGGGGILVQDQGGLTLIRSTVANNLVKANAALPLDEARGGGITYASSDHPLNATNSTISGNKVDSSGNTTNTTYGGAINWEGFGQAMNLTNVTISDNSAIGGGSASVFGGGIGLLGPGAKLRETILAGNQAPAQLDCVQTLSGSDWTSAGDNVIGDSSGCTHTGGSNDVFNVLPGLGALADYGGPTSTQLPNPGSPAIDRGGKCPTTDQRGFLRAAAAPCDAGAVEVGAVPPGSAHASVKREGKVKVRKGEHRHFVVQTGIDASCPSAGTTCRGSAVVERAADARGLALTSRRRKPLGRANLSVAAGKTQAVKVTLTRKASRALRRKGRLKVAISVTLVGPAGAPATATRSAELKPPKRRHH